MKIRLDSYLSLSTGLAPCSFLFLNKWLNQFSLADFLVAASVKLWVTLITHYQFWRQWDFITFVSCCLNGAICQKINLPLKLEKQLLGRWPYGRCQTDIFHIGFINGSWVPGRGNSLFGGKWCLSKLQAGSQYLPFNFRTAAPRHSAWVCIQKERIHRFVFKVCVSVSVL